MSTRPRQRRNQTCPDILARRLKGRSAPPASRSPGPARPIARTCACRGSHGPRSRIAPPRSGRACGLWPSSRSARRRLRSGGFQRGCVASRDWAAIRAIRTAARDSARTRIPPQAGLYPALRRRLTPMGAAAVTARAMYLLHHGICVPDYERLLEHGYSRLIEPGNVVFDVGAHWGRHLEPFVRLVGEQGRGFGFEPLPGPARALAQPYSNNPRVTIKALALSNRSGKDTFRIVENGLGLSGLKQREHSPLTSVFRLPQNRLGSALLRRALFAFGRFSIAAWAVRHGRMIVRDLPVEVDTIDAQAASLTRLDFIKLDIEGGEMDCLRGAEQTVARHR